MPDAALQALLDPSDTGEGIRILRRSDSTDGTTQNYCVAGGAVGPGRFRWVATSSGDSDATKNTTIRAALTG